MATVSYRHADEVAHSNQAARMIIPEILRVVGEVHSVVDVGGGVGGWLRVFQEHGVPEILLVDSRRLTPDCSFRATASSR